MWTPFRAVAAQQDRPHSSPCYPAARVDPAEPHGEAKADHLADADAEEQPQSRRGERDPVHQPPLQRALRTGFGVKGLSRIRLKTFNPIKP